MHPVICQIGPFTVYSYGVMMALAVCACAFLLSRDARTEGISADALFDLVFWVVISGIIGSRLFFVFLNFPYFLENPAEIFMLQHGGLAWQGGLILGTFGAFVFIKKKALPFAKTLDLMAPYVALGQGIGRLGCFLNGCCYGREVPWGIYFPVHQARLHPTQLYSAAGLLIIFLVLKGLRKKSLLPGQSMLFYLLFASVLRFFVEFFRADHSIAFMGLSIYQIISIGVFIIAIYANVLLKSRSRGPSA